MMSQIESTRTTLSGEFIDTLFDKSELQHSTITGNYTKCSFERADLRHTNITDAVFTECNFSTTDSCYSTWNNCKFTNCNVLDADFSRAIFNDCIFVSTYALPPHVKLDSCTEMNNCTISTDDIETYYEDYRYKIKNIDNLHTSIHDSLSKSIKEQFDEVLVLIKTELESDNARNFVKYIIQKVINRSHFHITDGYINASTTEELRNKLCIYANYISTSRELIEYFNPKLSYINSKIINTEIYNIIPDIVKVFKCD